MDSTKTLSIDQLRSSQQTNQKKHTLLLTKQLSNLNSKIYTNFDYLVAQDLMNFKARYFDYNTMWKNFDVNFTMFFSNFNFVQKQLRFKLSAKE